MDTRLLVACGSLEEAARIAHSLQPPATAGVSSFHVHCVAIEHACALAARTHPEVALLEMQPGLQLLPAFSQVSPGTRVLLICGACAPTDILNAVRLGAAGCVLRTSPPPLIAKAVRVVHEGGSWYPREWVVQALRLQFGIQTRRTPDGPPLTQREEQILQLIGRGLSNKEIGRRLDISDHTVKTHLHRVYAKLQQSGRFKAYLAQPRPAGDAAADAG